MPPDNGRVVLAWLDCMFLRVLGLCCFFLFSVCFGLVFRLGFSPIQGFSSGFFPGGRGPWPPKYLVLDFGWPPALVCFHVCACVYIVCCVELVFDDVYGVHSRPYHLLLVFDDVYGVHSRPYHSCDVISGWGQHARVHVTGAKLNLKFSTLWARATELLLD